MRYLDSAGAFEWLEKLVLALHQTWSWGGGGVMFRGTGICGFRFACGAGVCSGFVTIFCSGQGRFGDMCLVSCQKV